MVSNFPKLFTSVDKILSQGPVRGPLDTLAQALQMAVKENERQHQEVAHWWQRWGGAIHNWHGGGQGGHHTVGVWQRVTRPRFKFGTDTFITSVSISRLKISTSQCRDRDYKYQSCRDQDSSRLWFFKVVETETHRDSDFSKLSRPRLIETLIFQSCRDRDPSRLWFFKVVVTETQEYGGCRDRDPSRLGKSSRDRDFLHNSFSGVKTLNLFNTVSL